MRVDELLLKKKMKKKKTKILKEVNITPQDSIKLGNITFIPPFYSLSERVYDSNQENLCMAVNPQVARYIADTL